MSLFDRFPSWGGFGGSEGGGARSGAVGKRTLVETRLGQVRRQETAGVIEVPGHSPIPISALDKLLHDPSALLHLPPEALLAIARHLQAPTLLFPGPLPLLVEWIIQHLRKKGTTPATPTPTTTTTPATTTTTPSASSMMSGEDSRHDLLAKISIARRRLLPAVEAEHTAAGRMKAQQDMADVLTPLLDSVAVFPADTRYEHPDPKVQDDVLAAVQLRAAMQAHSRLGDKGAEAEARKKGGLPKGQWCGAFAFAHAAGAGLDGDFAGDSLGTGPGMGLDNLFTYKDGHRWIWTGAEWKGTREYHNDRGSVRHFTIVPAHPSPGSLDIRPGDIVLKDNARGTFADHITTCAAYDPSTGMLTTVGGNEGSATMNAAGVGEGSVNIGSNPSPETVADGVSKATRIYAIGRWSVVDFENHVFSGSAAKPTQTPTVTPKGGGGPKPTPSTPNPTPPPSKPRAARTGGYPSAAFDWTTIQEPTAEQRQQLVALAQARAAMPVHVTGNSTTGLNYQKPVKNKAKNEYYEGGYEYYGKKGTNHDAEDRLVRLVAKELGHGEGGVSTIMTWDGGFSIGAGFLNGAAAEVISKWQGDTFVANALRGAGVFAKGSTFLAVADNGDVVSGAPAIQVIRKSLPLLSMIMDLAEEPDHFKTLDKAQNDWMRDKHLSNLPPGADKWNDAAFACTMHAEHGHPAYGWSYPGNGAIYIAEGESGKGIARAYAKARAKVGLGRKSNKAIVVGTGNSEVMVTTWMPHFGRGVGSEGYVWNGVKTGAKVKMSVNQAAAAPELARHILYLSGAVADDNEVVEMYDLGEE